MVAPSRRMTATAAMTAREQTAWAPALARCFRSFGRGKKDRFCIKSCGSPDSPRKLMGNACETRRSSRSRAGDLLLERPDHRHGRDDRECRAARHSVRAPCAHVGAAMDPGCVHAGRGELPHAGGIDLGSLWPPQDFPDRTLRVHRRLAAVQLRGNDRPVDRISGASGRRGFNAQWDSPRFTPGCSPFRWRC